MKCSKSFTNIYSEIRHVLKNHVIVSANYLPTLNNIPSKNNKKIVVTAVWDTGATCTAISSNVVDKLNLPLTDVGTVHTAGGSIYTQMYTLDIFLPNNCLQKGIDVHQLPNLFGSDMLIGMDIISKGDLAISNFNNKTCFTFRQPSLETIDFKNINK